MIAAGKPQTVCVHFENLQRAEKEIMHVRQEKEKVNRAPLYLDKRLDIACKASKNNSS